MNETNELLFTESKSCSSLCSVTGSRLEIASLSILQFSILSIQNLTFSWRTMNEMHFSINRERSSITTTASIEYSFLIDSMRGIEPIETQPSKWKIRRILVEESMIDSNLIISILQLSHLLINWNPECFCLWIRPKEDSSTHNWVSCICSISYWQINLTVIEVREELNSGVSITRKDMSINDKVQSKWRISIIQHSSIPLFPFHERHIIIMNPIVHIDVIIEFIRNRTVGDNSNTTLEWEEEMKSTFWLSFLIYLELIMVCDMNRVDPLHRWG